MTHIRTQMSLHVHRERKRGIRGDENVEEMRRGGWGVSEVVKMARESEGGVGWGEGGDVSVVVYSINVSRKLTRTLPARRGLGKKNKKSDKQLS